MNSAQRKRMSISKKILVVTLCFSLPMILLAYFVIDNIDSNSRVARLELMGDAYQTPLETILRATGEHQRLVHHSVGDTKSQLAAYNAEVEKGLKALHEVDQQYGQTLQFTTEGLAKRKRDSATLQNLEKSWSEIVQIVGSTNGAATADLDKKYDNVNTIINTMITHLGDTSTLILDPELDTYYTMDITLDALPQNQNRIETMIANARDAYQHGTFTMDDRITLASNAAQLQASDMDRVSGDVQTALNENPNDFHGAVAAFQTTMPAALQQWTAANAALVELTKQLSSSATPSVSFDDYTAAAVKAREASFRFWSIVTPQNDNLLQLRIDYYNKHRNVSLLMSAGALLFSMLIAYVVARSMIVPLNKLALTLSPGATLLLGSVKQLSEASTEGPMDAQTAGIICDELTAHAEDMHGTSSELEVLVFGKEMNQSRKAA